MANPRFHRILVTTDFSDGPADALVYAFSIAEENESRITLLHVLPDTAADLSGKYRGFLIKGVQTKLDGFVPAEARTYDVLGNSNITLPLSIQTVRSRGSEVRLNSPGFRRFRFHLAYANMIVRGRGGVTGGMTDFAPPTGGIFIIDHDQRHTLSSGANINLPRGVWFSTNVVAGSGFLDGDGPNHLPAPATIDLALGKSLSRSVSATLTILNLTNTRFLLGRESSFAGTHYNDPRQFSLQLRYRFHM